MCRLFKVSADNWRKQNRHKLFVYVILDIHDITACHITWYVQRGKLRLCPTCIERFVFCSLLFFFTFFFICCASCMHLCCLSLLLLQLHAKDPIPSPILGSIPNRSPHNRLPVTLSQRAIGYWCTVPPPLPSLLSTSPATSLIPQQDVRGRGNCCHFGCFRLLLLLLHLLPTNQEPMRGCARASEGNGGEHAARAGRGAELIYACI